MDENMKNIYVTRSSLPDIEDYIKEIRPIFESRILTNMGPIYKKFQHMLIDYLGVKYLSLFVNGHMALEMALQALLGTGSERKIAGGEVITTPFTFISTTHAITRSNLKPVFCDIRPSDYTIDPEKIEPLITDRTVAIIPVHVYGNVCDIEAIQRIADRYGLKVIYDAAHVFGVTYKGVGIGNYGDASMFSFHATKVFNSIEGGAVAFSDDRYRTALHELKNFGIHGQEEVTGIGGNAKLNEFAAAMGICNIRRMEICIQRRKAAYDRYIQRLSGVPGIQLCAPQKDVEPNYSYFPVLFDEEAFGQNRNQVFEALKQQGIFARKYFYPAANDTEAYRHMETHETPIAHDISLRVLTLPMYEELSVEEVDRICDVVLRKP